MTEPLPPTGFWSYTRDDDAASGGRLSRLRVLLTTEPRARFGKTAYVRIFQDVAAMPFRECTQSRQPYRALSYVINSPNGSQ